MKAHWQPWLFCLVLLGAGQDAQAHEMGTAALVLQETESATGNWVFKRTIGADGKVPPIDFNLLPACELRDITTQWEGDTEVVQRGSFHCNSGLKNHQVQASGFTRLAPELIVVLNARQGAGMGERIHAVLTPSQPVLAADTPREHSPPLTYLVVGIEHIVFGWDHVLFVTGLFLLWRQRRQTTRQLIGQFTLFTAGHSLTLALLVLGFIAVPTRAIEAWIALSVLWLGWELIRPQQPAEIGTWHLLLIAAFGLLHGSGFALSMEERGFPEDALFSTLLLFNLGIEIGQLLIVLMLALAFRLIESTGLPTWASRLHVTLTLLTGGAALYWTVERIHSYV